MEQPAQRIVPPRLTDVIEPLLDANCPEGTALGNAYGKVRGLLVDYAERLDTTYGRLRITDVFDTQGRLRPKLDTFVNSIPRLAKQTEARHRAYKNEARSTLRRLFRALYPSALPRKRETCPYGILFDQVPEVLKPVLPHLPQPRAGRLRADGDARMPELLESGVWALSALLNVWEAYGSHTLEELMVGHSADISRELKKIAPVKVCPSANQVIRTLRLEFNLTLPPRYDPPLAKEFWPLKLRKEWDIFHSLATNGIGNDIELELTAKRHRFSVKTLAPQTIGGYERGIGAGLKIIPWDDELSVLDLIRITPHLDPSMAASYPNGYNPLTDMVREAERAKEGFINGVGFDSSAFFQFVCGVKAVAARTGHGTLIRSFNLAYRVCRNKEATEARKEAKKAGISLEWVDDQIELLYVEFKRIIRTGSYKPKPGRIRPARRDAGLLLFFVILVTLRYMGYRQQSLVDCKLGTNIIFRSDGSIVLHFDKTKNRKRIHMELNESRRDSHGLLLDVLTLYYTRVYPYLRRASNDTLGGQFFLTGTIDEGSFRSFEDKDDFNSSFFTNRERFLDLDSLPHEMRRQLHPHFLRGLCTDWMIKVLHMTEYEVAEVLGDEPATVRVYVDKNRVRDAGSAFDAANSRNRLIKEVAGLPKQFAEALAKIEQNFELRLKQKDEEIATLRRDLRA